MEIEKTKAKTKRLPSRDFSKCKEKRIRRNANIIDGTTTYRKYKYLYTNGIDEEIAVFAKSTCIRYKKDYLGLVAFLSNIDQKLADAVIIIYTRKYRAKNLVQLLKTENDLYDINKMKMNISALARGFLIDASNDNLRIYEREFLEWKRMNKI